MVEEIKEQPISPEQIPEQGSEPLIEKPVSPETKETEAQVVGSEKIKQVIKPIKKVLSKTQSQVKPDLIVKKTETFKQIEDILSEGLDQAYEEMPDELKKEFRKKGEETASKIEELVSQVKVMVHKVVDLIKNWLLIIPGVNKFFLEQETKIKTEKILGLAEKKKKDKLK